MERIWGKTSDGRRLRSRLSDQSQQTWWTEQAGDVEREMRCSHRRQMSLFAPHKERRKRARLTLTPAKAEQMEVTEKGDGGGRREDVSCHGARSGYRSNQ